MYLFGFIGFPSMLFILLLLLVDILPFEIDLKLSENFCDFSEDRYRLLFDELEREFLADYLDRDNNSFLILDV